MGAPRLALVGWRLRRLARGLDWTLAVALALLVFDAAFYVSAVAPATRHVEALRAQTATLRNQPDLAPETKPVDPGAELRIFYASLAPRQGVPDLLHHLHQAANRNGLAIEQADYRPVPDQGGRLVRYQVQLPARGTYPQLRRFLAQAGRELPGLALDGLELRREHAGDGVIDAQVRFTLFVGAGTRGVADAN
jgi:hypothetical protein